MEHSTEKLFPIPQSLHVAKAHTNDDGACFFPLFLSWHQLKISMFKVTYSWQVQHLFGRWYRLSSSFIFRFCDFWAAIMPEKNNIGLPNPEKCISTWHEN